MKIGIDCRMIDWTGVGRYTVSLLRGLAEVNPSHDFVLFSSPKTAHLVPDGPKFAQVIVPQEVFSLPAQIGWSRELENRQLDLLHVPHWPVPLFYWGKLAVNIHDLIPLIISGAMPNPVSRWVFKAWVRRAARMAGRVITGSEATKADLVRLLRIEGPKVTVISDPVLFDPANVERQREKDLGSPSEKPYVLYVGAHKPHKNLIRLVESYSKLPQRLRSTYNLVLAGRPDPRFADLGKRIGELGLEGQVILSGYITDERLPDLYAGASLFVFPSLYEGFGLPPLEAMGYGIPVVASDRSSLPEVLGDGALFVDPENVEALATTMAQALTDASLAEELRQKGRVQAAKYSPRRCAEAMLQLYEELIYKQS